MRILKEDRVYDKKRNENFLWKSKIEFQDKETKLDYGDIIYLTTDGYVDQNNHERKRFGINSFLQVLNSVALKSMEEQKTDIELVATNILRQISFPRDC